MVWNDSAVFLRASLSTEDAMASEFHFDLLPLRFSHGLAWRDNFSKAASHVVLHSTEMLCTRHMAYLQLVLHGNPRGPAVLRHARPASEFHSPFRKRLVRSFT